MRTYLLTELRRITRNRKVVILTAAYPTVLYLIFGTSFDDGSLQDGVSVKSYLMVSMALFGATGAALAVSGVISAEREAGWTRQLRLTPLPGWVYVAAKVGTAVLSATLAIVMVFVVARATGAGEVGAGRVVVAALVLFVGMLPFAALGVFFGYLAIGQANRPIMMFSWMGLSILGGLWFPLDNLPTAVQDISKLTPTYQLADMSRDALTGAMPTAGGLGVLVGWTVVASVLAAWRFRADTVSATPALA